MENNIRIMVVDDEPIVGKRLKQTLEKDGYVVEAFTDSLIATNEFEKNPFDIIITDLKMEKIDGMNILENVKRKNPDTKVIIITGVGKWLTATEAFEKGAFDFIIKPFKLDEIRDVVQRAVKDLST
ncbi:MAG TPA: response regulator [Nitrospiraceae bacterium]|nr:response regulator [Nitrospiraceae bacterium]